VAGAERLRPYEITIKNEAQRVLNRFDERNHDAATVISDHLMLLSADPYTPRSGMDIRQITNSNPRTHYFRLGDQTRVEYVIDDNAHTVDIVKIMITKRRKSDYR
jgi:mRNA-degrading endonuclease RelE of RelBE toxin-antitoxin system